MSGSATVLLRPEHLRLVAGGDAIVELTEFYGHDTVYLVRTAAGRVVRVRAGSAPAHQRGDAVSVTYVGPPAVSYLDDEGPPRLSDGDEDAGWPANAPMPTWRPLTSTVVVPSGDAAVMRAGPAGHDVGVLQELQQAGGELELLGDAAHREAAPHA